MSEVITSPFSALTPGNYFYNRPIFKEPVKVEVDVRAGQFYILFPYNLTPMKVNQLPFDAEFTYRKVKKTKKIKKS